jgi:DNA-binding response OmpR family regulator
VTRVLLVEDDAALAKSLENYLQREGFEIAVAATLKAASAALPADVVVLDWMLPDGQGIDWLKALRNRGDPVRVLMLTARAEVIDRVVGLETGANDYLTKPFEPRELVARIRVQARENRGAQPERLSCGEISIELSAREVTFRGRAVALSKMEFQLLELLVRNPGRVFTREELLNQVWGFESFPTTRTVDTHVLQLRQKFSADLLETVRGVGYRLKKGMTST